MFEVFVNNNCEAYTIDWQESVLQSRKAHKSYLWGVWKKGK